MKEIGNNNCQNDSQSLKINNSITYNPQKIANTFNDYFSTVADTPIGKIKKDKNDPRVKVNPSNYLINNLNSTFPRINWKYATTYETDKICKSIMTKNSCEYDEFPVKILKLSALLSLPPLPVLVTNPFPLVYSLTD
jgi:hypothetical protein